MPPSGVDPASALRAVRRNLRSRRSITLFENKPVDPQILIDAIEIARWAPNHHLTQPWHFYLLGDKARAATLRIVEQVVGERRTARIGARKAKKWSKIPGWIVVTCALSEDSLTQMEDYAACSCAIHSMSLYLWELGIGTKWTTGPITRDPRYFEALGLDIDEVMIVGLVSYGYPKLIPIQKRNEVADILTRLR